MTKFNRVALLLPYSFKENPSESQVLAGVRFLRQSRHRTETRPTSDAYFQD